MGDVLRELFDSFTSDENFQTAIRDRRAEGLYLEFKQKHDRSGPDLHEDDRKNFSMALSGFANSDGGVLIFGVETKKIDGLDRAHKLKPIAQAQTFMARLQDSVLNATEPPVDGLDFRHVQSADSVHAGYVTCLVPASDKVPHRAVLAGREYYRRTAGGFRMLEHVDLEDMFGRRPRPKLEVGLMLSPSENGRERLTVYFFNEGRATAKYGGALGRLFNPDAMIVGAGGDVSDVSDLNGGSPAFQFIERPGVVIHPNGIARAVGWILVARRDTTCPLKTRVRWYCDRMQWREGVVELHPGVIQRVG